MRTFRASTLFRSLLLFAGFAAGAASAQSSLSFVSEPGDYIGQGLTRNMVEPGFTITARMQSPEYIVVYVEEAGTAPGRLRFSLDLAAPPGTPLAAGAYENTYRTAFRGMSPGVDFSGDGRGCNRAYGRFVVHNIEVSGETVLRFTASFEQTCENTDRPVLRGQVSFTAPAAAGPSGPSDSTPNPFKLIAPAPVAPGQWVYSSPVTITGVNTAVPLAITAGGGEYSINGGPFTSAPGSAQPFDRIVVRLQASNVPYTRLYTTLNAGGIFESLNVESSNLASPGSGITWRGAEGHPITGREDKAYLIPPNLMRAWRRGEGLQLILDGLLGADVTLLMGGPNMTPVSVGTFTSNRMGTDGLALLDLYADGGCNQSFGQFTVHEVAYSPEGELAALAVDFSIRCETAPTATGQVRFNSSVAFTDIPPPPPGPCVSGDDDGDGLPNCMEAFEGLDPLVKDNDIFANNRLFAMQLYRDLFNREATANEVTFWVGALNENRVTRLNAMDGYFNAGEFAQAMAPVTRLYLAYFLRIPDYNGLTFWLDYYRGGQPTYAISNYFAGSPEFMNRYGSLSNADFVTLVYNNVLGRAPDPGGQAYWTAELDSGRRTRGQVMLGFSDSPEYVNLSAAEVYVTMTYFALMRRAPDPDGFGYWVNQIDIGLPKIHVLNTFLTSPEYRARFLAP